jgi:hypothetical protein
MGKAKRAKQKRKRHQWIVVGAAAVAAVGLGVAFLSWSGGGPSEINVQASPSGDRFESVEAGALPSFAKQGRAKVQEAYRYAAAHPEVLQYIPCYCGCENVGHRHNADCYVKERHADGRVTFTSHAAT